MAGYLYRVTLNPEPLRLQLDSTSWAFASYAESLSVLDPLHDCIANDCDCPDSQRLLFHDAPGVEVVTEASLRLIARSPEPTTVRSYSARSGIRPDDVRNHVVSD